MKQKRGEGKQIFQKGGQAGSRGGFLKKGEWVWDPLTNCEEKHEGKDEKSVIIKVL